MVENVAVSQPVAQPTGFSKRKLWNQGAKVLIWGSAILTCVLLAFIIGYIFYRGVPYLSWELLTSQSSYVKKTIGILPNLMNTLYIILVAMVIVLPLGTGAAIYLTEYATNKKLVKLIEFASEALTGIPSIIFGLAGLVLFSEMFGLKQGILAGGLTLVMMVLPVIIRTTQESLKTVPNAYREGSLAMGASKWHMVRTVVLPNAVDGIVTGCILSIGRIVGESAALLFTAGSARLLPKLGGNLLENLERLGAKTLQSGGTLTIELYLQMQNGKYDTAFGVGCVLIVIVLIINLLLKLVTGEFRKA